MKKRESLAGKAKGVERRDALRLMADEPELALRGMRGAVDMWRSICDSPDFDEAVATKLFGELKPGRLQDFATYLEYRAAAFERGKAEAQSLLERIEEHGLAGLGPYLKEHPVSPTCVAWLLAENRRLTVSLAASEAASMKNRPAREHVAKLWAERSDLGQSKASFARMIEHEVKRKFGVSVTPDRIARYWLPKG